MRVSLWTLAVSATMCGALLGQTRVAFHLLPAVSTGPLSPSWSPDGRSLAFSMRGDIWTIPAEGGEAVALTEGPAYHFELAFSPDGSSVALTMDIDGNLDIGSLTPLVGRWSGSRTTRRWTSSPVGVPTARVCTSSVEGAGVWTFTVWG